MAAHSPDRPSQIPRQFSASELADWQLRIAAANHHNILHHCRQCDREWVASNDENCACGSKAVERLCCWQFPDD